MPADEGQWQVGKGSHRQAPDSFVKCLPLYALIPHSAPETRRFLIAGQYVPLGSLWPRLRPWQLPGTPANSGAADVGSLIITAADVVDVVSRQY